MTDRNDPCPCGSGKKYKKCHGAKGEAAPPAGRSAAPGGAGKGNAGASEGKPSGSQAAKTTAAASSAPEGAGEPSIHTHRAANPSKDETARKRHLQRRTESPSLRGSLFYKLKD